MKKKKSFLLRELSLKTTVKNCPVIRAQGGVMNLKKSCMFSLLFICLIYPVFSQQDGKTIREDVLVENVEIPVRVFFKGKPVENLTRDDFILYESGKPQTINGFFTRKSKIAASPEPSRESIKSRYFVLDFKVVDYNAEMKKGLRYMFDNILRNTDQLLVFVNRRQVFFENLRDKKYAHSRLETLLTEQSEIVKTRLKLHMQKLRSDSSIKFRLWSEHRGFIKKAYEFMKVQQDAWNLYRNKYIIPDVTKYIKLAMHLQNIKKPKFVINLFQLELVPSISKRGSMYRGVQTFIDDYDHGGLPHERRIMTKMWGQVDKQIGEASSFLVNDISQLFYGVEASYHCIMVPVRFKSVSDEFEYKTTPTHIENSLRKISKDTGGSLLTSPNLDQALATIKEKETKYYVLTFAPKKPGNVGEIKIDTKNKHHKVVYDNNKRVEYLTAFLEQYKKIPNVEISDLSLKNKKLLISVNNFLRVKTPKGKAGKIAMKVIVKDGNNKELYNTSKSMKSTKKSINVSIPFQWLKKGEYFIIADVKDLLTGAVDIKLLQPVIK